MTSAKYLKTFRTLEKSSEKSCGVKKILLPLPRCRVLGPRAVSQIGAAAQRTGASRGGQTQAPGNYQREPARWTEPIRAKPPPQPVTPDTRRPAAFSPSSSSTHSHPKTPRRSHGRTRAGNCPADRRLSPLTLASELERNREYFARLSHVSSPTV